MGAVECGGGLWPEEGKAGEQTTMFTTSFITNGSIFSHGLHHTHDLDEL